MGMFDLIKVDKSLSLNLPPEFDLIDPDTLEFQTKDLQNTLSVFLIKKDGLYLVDKDQSARNLNFHGILNFGAFYSQDLVDYMVDYKAKFTDGVLVDLSLVKFVENFHESKKEKFESLKARFEKDSNRFHKKILRAFQKIIVVFLNVFGLGLSSKRLGFISNEKFGILFLFPKILLLYEKQHRFCNYGFLLDDITTGVSYSKSPYSRSLLIAFLGFGFEIKFFDYNLGG